MTKPCPQDKVRNPATGRCVSKTGAIGKRILGSKTPQSPKPNTPAKKSCPQDKVRNPATGRCVSKTGAIGKKILGSKTPQSPKPNKRSAPAKKVISSKKSQTYGSPSFKEELQKIKAESSSKTVSALLKEEGLVSSGPIGKSFKYFGFNESNVRQFSEFIEKLVYFMCKNRLSLTEDDFGVYYIHYKRGRLYLYVPEYIQDAGVVTKPADLFRKVGPSYKCNPRHILSSVKNSLVEYEREEAEGEFKGKKLTKLISQINRLNRELN